MADAIHIMVVDDDPALLKLVSTKLQTDGYRVTVARNGAEALVALDNEPPNLIVLDLLMPRVDGIEVCRQVRAKSQVPIIVLSGEGDQDRKVEALDLGADDYLTKPFGMPELLARIRAVLRRASEPGTGTTQHFQKGNLSMDFASRQVAVGEREVHLTPTEYTLLSELVQHRGKVLTHDMLLGKVWGQEYLGSTQYLHIYIGRLRNKLTGLDGVEIVTEPGIGYWLRVL